KNLRTGHVSLNPNPVLSSWVVTEKPALQNGIEMDRPPAPFRPKILPGLYIGNFKDARDAEQLSKNKVTHILSVHDSARPTLEAASQPCALFGTTRCQVGTRPRNPSTLWLPSRYQVFNLTELPPCGTSVSLAALPDTVGASLMDEIRTRHFKESIQFIHECRLRGEGCLVHCLAGVSRSVTLVVAYIMTVTDFGWEDALRTVRAGRSCANPNLGFQRQLQEFEERQVRQFRQWLKEEYGESPLRDAEEARGILALLPPDHLRALLPHPVTLR
ncbi:hypothetical protein E2I00_012955, partial [Balaenoptera physalus]